MRVFLRLFNVKCVHFTIVKRKLQVILQLCAWLYDYLS